MIMNLIRRLFAPKSVPDDLKAFEEARKRLHQSTRSFAREVDDFGAMVNGMRGKRSRKHGCTSKPAKKRGSRKSC